MASSSGRKSGSSGRPGPRKRVVIGAAETVRVRYDKDKPHIEAERKKPARKSTRASGPAVAQAGVRRPKPSAHARRVSAAKRDERERRQRVMRARLYASVAAAVLLIGLVAWGIVSLYNAQIFVVREVRVEGTSLLTQEHVMQLAAVPAETTLLRVPSAAITKRVRRDPWVQSVRVERDFPSTLMIRVVERKPAVVVDAGGTNLWMVSNDGVWLGKSTVVASDTIIVRDLDRPMPAVGKKTTSKELLNAIQIARGISPQLRNMVRAISAPTIDKTALITADDVEVFVGAATQLERKDRIARSILAKEKGKVVYINVRVPGHETWRGLDSLNQ